MRSLLRTPLGTSLDTSLVRDSSLVWLASGVVGVSFGAISVAGGLPVWVPVLMSLIVYAGSAQFSAVGVLLAGGGPFAAAATGLLLNTRTAAFGLAVADVLGRGGSPASSARTWSRTRRWPSPSPSRIRHGAGPRSG